jgi:DNA-binding LacI/PurR family transcriptional regulator
VGRDTIRLMLAELTAEGVIAGGESGRNRRLRGSPNAIGTHHRENWRIGMLSPFRLERLSQPVLAEVDQVRSLLAQRGGVLELLSPPWYDAPQPQKKLLQMLVAEPRDAWILYRSSREIQAAFRASHTPCVIRGYPHQGIDLPYMDCDWTATGRHAVGELWRKGHRRIGLLMPQDGLRGNTAAWQGAASFQEEGVSLTEIWDDGTNTGLIAAVAAAIRHAAAPTAFITLRPRQTLTLLTWLCSQGFRVPRDFSLISLATESFMNHCVPMMTAYRLDPLVFAKRVVRHLELLLGGQLGPQGSLLLMPELVQGASVAPRGGGGLTATGWF